MSTWKETTLGEVCDEVNGIIQTGPFGSQLHQSDYSEVGIPVVMPKDIIEGKISADTVARVSAEHVERLSRHRLSPGDIVYGRRGDIGRQALIRREQAGWMCGTGCLRLSLGEAVLDPLFLHYYLKQNEVVGWIANQAVGATMPNLNTDILRSVPVRFPQLPIQRRIAGILSAYDDLIENSQRRIKILEEMARRLYREWFVHFRFPGHEDCAFVDSPLGEIPEGWEGVFASIATIERTGISPGDYPSENFQHFSIPSFDEGQAPANETGREILSGKYLINGSHVLLSKLNPRIPRVWLPEPSANHQAICSTEFIPLRPEAGFSREFIFCKCTSEEFSGRFRSLAIGTSTSHQRVKPESLIAMATTVPEPRLVSQFTAIVAPMLAMNERLRQGNKTLRRTRDLLLPRLLSGQIDVEKLPEPGLNATEPLE